MSHVDAVPRATVRGLWLIAAAAALALAAALGLQYLGGYAPCQLCIYGRIPYVAVLVVAALGLWLRRPRLALAMAILPLAAGVGLSVYHVGVEEGWFVLPGGCVAGAAATTIEDLRAQLAAARPTCDQVPLTVLGLSLAGWNGVYGALLLAGTVFLLFGDWRSAAEQHRRPRLA